MTKKIAIVGSSNLEVTASVGAEIVDLVRAYGQNTVLLTRGSGEFDHFIATIAPLLELRCFAYPSSGGRENWQRDVDLVKDADEVLVIVSRADLEAKKESGTMHVLEKALQQEKPTRLFTTVDGSLVGVASDDGREGIE